MCRSKNNVLAYRFFQKVQQRIEAAKQAAETGDDVTESTATAADQRTEPMGKREPPQEAITIVVDKDRNGKEWRMAAAFRNYNETKIIDLRFNSTGNNPYSC